MTMVDERVVQMDFQNDKFEQGISTSLKSLNKLDDQIKGMSKNSALDSIGESVDQISNKFSNLGIVGMAALSNIANRAVDAGARLVKSLTVDQVFAGWQEYELKMGSIQTILNSAKNADGTAVSLNQVTNALNELNKYADQTIYSFSDMTNNIGKFTNAGVSLQDSVAAIQGVSNVAALAGANAWQASRAMYNFGQALGTGYVKLIDWRSIENAQMATTTFKNDIMETAVAYGTLKKAADGTYKTLKGTTVTTSNFNMTLQDGWFTSEILTESLKHFSDTTTDVGKKAMQAATEVKTFTQLLATLREASGSAWAETFELIFGNFTEGKNLWTSINNVVDSMLSKMADARNEMLFGWKYSGGQKDFVESLSNSFDNLGIIIDSVSTAFQKLNGTFGKTKDFASTIYKVIQNIGAGSVGLKEWRSIENAGYATDDLKLTLLETAAAYETLTKSEDGTFKTLNGTEVTVSNFSSTLEEGWLIAEEFNDAFTEMGFNLDEISKGSRILYSISSFFKNLSISIHEILVDFNGAEKISNIISGFLSPLKLITAAFDAIRRLLGLTIGEAEYGYPKIFKILNFLENVANKISYVVDAILGKASPAFENFFSALEGRMDNISKALEKVPSNIDKVYNATTGQLEKLKTPIQKVQEFFEKLANTIMDRLHKALEQAGISVGSLGLLLTGLAGYLGTKVIKSIITFLVTPLRALKDILVHNPIGEVFDELTNALQKLQEEVEAKAIRNIALSIAVLAFSLFLLSSVEPGAMMSSIGALALIFAELFGAIIILEKTVKNITAVKDILTMGTALLLLSAAVFGLAVSLKILSTIDDDGLTKGLMGLGVILLELIGFLKLFSSIAGKIGGLGKAAIGIAILSGSILILVGSVALLSKMDWGSLIKGLVGLAAILISVSLTMEVLGHVSPKAAVGAIGVLILAGALNVLIPLLLIIGNMDVNALKQGMAGLVLSLTMLAAVMGILSVIGPGATVGAAGILLLSGALAILVPVLITLGSIKFGVLAKAIGEFVLILAVLVGMSLVISAFSASLMIMAGILLALTVAMLAFGAGVFALAAGLQIITTLGAGASGAITLLLFTIADAIPRIATSIAEGFIVFTEKIAEGAPRIAEAVFQLILTVMDTISQHSEELAVAGVKLIISLVKGIISAWGYVIQAAKELVSKFVESFKQTGFWQAIQAGIEFIEKIKQGIRQKIQDIYNLGKEVVQGFINGLKSLIKNIFHIGKDMGNQALAGAQQAVDAHSPSREFEKLGRYSALGFAVGIKKFSDIPEKAAKSMASKTLDAVANSMDDLDISPTITPILDASNVEKGASQLNNLFGSDVLYSASSSLASISQNGGMLEILNGGLSKAFDNLTAQLSTMQAEPRTAVYINGDYANDAGIISITEAYLEDLARYGAM